MTLIRLQDMYRSANENTIATWTKMPGSEKSEKKTTTIR